MDAVVDVTNIVLETERLILRAYRPTDLDDFFEYASEKEVGDMAGWKAHESIEESKEILNLFLEEKKTLAIVYKENNKVIGSIGLEPLRTDLIGNKYNHLKGREIGYALSRNYWGKKIMPEAVKHVIDYLFKEEGYDFLSVCHFKTNHRSQRVIEKCGFKFIKEENLDTAIMKNVPGKVYVLLNDRKNSNNIYAKKCV